MTEVHKSVQAFFKSIHAKPRIAKLKTNDNEMKGAEGIEDKTNDLENEDEQFTIE